MNRRELMEIWTPAASIWHPWAKPAIFLCAPENAEHPRSGLEIDSVHTPWAPPPSDTAIILDLPGPDAVSTALALAGRGYQPVPLFNTTHGFEPVHDLRPVVDNLVAGAAQLAEIGVPREAPPVFLLDDDRYCTEARPGQYDNRWVTFAEDFPSPARLQSCGIRRALIVHRSSRLICEDLARVLITWRRARIQIQGVRSDATTPVEIGLPHLWTCRLAAWWAMISFGLWRNGNGGFGRYVPLPSERHRMG